MNYPTCVYHSSHGRNNLKEEGFTLPHVTEGAVHGSLNMLLWAQPEYAAMGLWKAENSSGNHMCKSGYSVYTVKEEESQSGGGARK